MPSVHGYVRASTDEQYETLIVQRRQIEEAYQHRYRPKNFNWAGIYEDGGVSASRPLRQRPEGCKLQAAVRKGDVVVITKLDRGFRSARDFFTTFEDWRERGVGVCMLDMDLDTSSPVGGLIAGVMAVVAEFERRRIGERTREVAASRRRQHKPVGAAPYGWILAGPKGQKRFAPDHFTRELARRVIAWYEGGWTWEAIYIHLLSPGLRIKRPAGARGGAGSEYSVSALKRMYKAEKILQALEAQGIHYPFTISRMLAEAPDPR